MLEEFRVRYALFEQDPDAEPICFLSLRLVAMDRDCARAEAKRLLRAAVDTHLPEHLQHLCVDPARDVEITVLPWAVYGAHMDAAYARLVRYSAPADDDDDDE